MACGSCNLTFGQSEVMALLMVKGQVVSAVHHNGGGKCLARALTRRPTAAVVVVRAVGGEVPPRYLDPNTSRFREPAPLGAQAL